MALSLYSNMRSNISVYIGVRRRLLCIIRSYTQKTPSNQSKLPTMCHLVGPPMRRYETLYEQIVEDLEYRGGEPTEGAPPLPEFIEDNVPMADASPDLQDYRFAQDLEWLWPAREERWTEIHEARGTNWLIAPLERYFDEAVSKWAYNDNFSPYYNDYFLRRFLHHLPKKMDFDSWVGKALIEHVAWRHNIPVDRIRPSKSKKTLTYEVGDYWPHKWAKVLKKIEAELDAIPTFLFDLALEYSIWLPYEMQLITSFTDQDLLDRYRKGHYSMGPQTLRPYSENGCGDFYLNCQMHTRLVLGYDWFELAFINTSYNIHW